MIDDVRRGEVVVSIRPSLSGAAPTHSSTSVTLVHPQEHRRDTFQFDHVYRAGGNEVESTSHLWQAVRPLADAMVAGRNACLIAFGQTGTGKTSSLFGAGDTPAADSLVARFLAHVIEALPSNGTIVDTAITVTCAELYNEKVRDLFDNANGLTFTDRKVRFHAELGTYIEGLTRRSLFSAQDCTDLIMVARAARSGQFALRGEHLNRSHLIIQVQVRRRDLERGVQRNSTLNLVDCGGSERLPVRPGEPQKNIQLSLSMLRRVVDLLVQGGFKRDASSKKIFNLKDSLLTHALTESLSGNSRLMVLATISSEKQDYEESFATLTFASKFSQIPITARVNEESCSVVVHVIQQEMAAMQSRLQDASKMERNEDLARLQSELASKAELLQGERAEKTKRQDELHAQVQSTQEELSTIQSVLESKQLAAARAERLNDELARLMVARDVARQRLAQEEALQKQAEMRIAEAKLMELEIGNLRAERVQLEEQARKEQQAQSMKMMRNIFVVATQLGKERRELKKTQAYIETNVRRVDQLRKLLDAEEHRQYVEDAVVATYGHHYDELQAVHDRFEQNFAALTAARAAQDETSRKAISALRDAIVEQKRMKDVLDESLAAVNEKRMDSAVKLEKENALHQLAGEIAQLQATLQDIVDSETDSYNEANVLREKIHTQRQFVASAPFKLEERRRVKRVLDGKVEQLQVAVEILHHELASLEEEISALDQEKSTLDLSVTAVAVERTSASPRRLADEASSPEERRAFSPPKSPFLTQSEALAMSPFTRRFMKSASPS